jgi:hypothetical protein
VALQDELEAARKKVVKDGYDMSIGELMSLFRNSELIISPAFQRLYRWDLERKTRFIESLLLGIPVPPIFVFTTEKSQWELIDGLQRLSTVFEFAGILPSTENTGTRPLRLDGTKLLPSLNGIAWDETTEGSGDGLTAAQQLDIKRTRLRVEILKKESDEQAKFELFQRLNTGGAALSAQEVRDCVMVMVDKTFFDWVKGLATHESFSETTSMTERDTQQQKPTELVLRFMTYMTIPYDGKIGLHDYLDDAMLRLANTPDFDRKAYGKLFVETFDILHEVLGEGAFRKWNGAKFSGAFSISAFEAISVGFAKNLKHIRKMKKQERSRFIKARVKKIWSDEVFLRNSGAGVRGTQRLVNLIPHAPTFFE